jgi:hypothetical protein
MAVLRPHLALTVSDVQRAVPFYAALFDEMDTTCCYARQDKIWVRDPDGTPWEVFATLEDTEECCSEPEACCV